MHSIRNLRRWTATALICLLVIINASTVIAGPGESKFLGPPEISYKLKFPDQICVAGFTTCTQCAQPRCQSKKTVSSISPDVGSSNPQKPDNSNAKLIPAVIGSVFGIAVLAAAMFGYAKFRKQRGMGAGLFGNSKCTRLDDDSTKEWSMTSLSANVIPIAYMPPPTTPVTPTTPPEAVHQRMRASSVSIGTTPLASPLPRPYSTASDNPFASNEDEEVGTIVQATRGISPLPGTATTTATATVVTATRAKPALVRLNTIKSNNGSATDLRSLRSAYSGGASVPLTPNTPLTANSLLSVHSTTSTHYSELDFSLQSDGNLTVSSQTDELNKQRNNLNYNNDDNNNRVSGFNDRYSSPFVDSVDTPSATYDNGLMSPGNTTSLQLQRESMLSSVSSDPRSTFMSDMTRDGDGEIMIFWGGNNQPGTDVNNNEASRDSLIDKDNK
ncbi:539_t:CDS:2 [Paraglomus occultum]|uniref:539_t:CDS:1 n=1 Tax=Paraglomus occultum TaxID=144539 RepID=A0A9N8ZSY7_9GLOM|nr:539_t:CDS:2 [Paraglomus occultum]